MSIFINMGYTDITFSPAVLTMPCVTALSMKYSKLFFEKDENVNCQNLDFKRVGGNGQYQVILLRTFAGHLYLQELSTPSGRRSKGIGPHNEDTVSGMTQS